MIPSMLDAVRVEATLGEICDALRAEWGVTPSRLVLTPWAFPAPSPSRGRMRGHER